MSEKDKEAISAAFDDMAMYGRGFTRMTADGIKHIPYQEVMQKPHPCSYPICGCKGLPDCQRPPANHNWRDAP